jgi:hypothetical protein
VRKSTRYKKLKKMNDWRYFSHKKTRRSDWSGSFVWEIQIGKKKRRKRKRTYFRARHCHLHINKKIYIYLPTLRINNNFLKNIFFWKESIRNILSVMSLTIILNL